MTQSKKSRVVFAAVRVFSLGLLAIFFAHSPSEVAAKPPKPGGGGGTVPPGTIYFTYNTAVMGAKADGSGQFIEFPEGVSPVENGVVEIREPSQYYYGGKRWWLALVHDPATMTAPRTHPNGSTVTVTWKELFAVRPGSNGADADWVQLTNFGDVLNPDTDGVQIWGIVRWSNEPAASALADSFISLEVRLRNPDGSIVNPDGRVPRAACQINLGGEDLETVLALDAQRLWTPIQPDDELVTGQVPLGSGSQYSHDWAPDGIRYALDSDDGFTMGISIGTPDGDIQRITSGVAPRWSPVSDPSVERISYTDSGATYTIRPDGTGSLRVLAAPRNAARPTPVWSPDGKFLASSYVTLKRDGSYDKYQIQAFLAVANPTIVDVSAGLNDLVSKAILGWRSDLQWEELGL